MLGATRRAPTRRAIDSPPSLSLRYGLSWQIVPTALLELTANPDRERAARALAAMLRMKKSDIAELYQAADQT